MLINRDFTWQWKWRWEMKSEVQFCLLMWKLGPVISSYWVIINKSLHTYNTWHSLAIFLFVYLHFSRPSCPKLTLYNMTMWGHCSFQNVCAVCELLPPVVFPYTPVQQNHLPRDGGSILEQTKKKHAMSPVPRFCRENSSRICNTWKPQGHLNWVERVNERKLQN